jgi:lipopolysaccharide transport system permease protein
VNRYRISVYKNLFFSLVAREIQMRYRGSWLGLFWVVINPLLLMLVYYFVFNLVFKVKLPQLYDGRDVPFAGFIFSGLIVYFLFAEIINRSPTLIQDNTNYVKKVVFPIEIIPLVAVVASAFNFLISFVILVLFLLLFGGGITQAVLLAPVIILPFLLFLAGLAWFTSAIAVYIRDVTYIAGFIATAMMFLSPVFYAMESVPAQFRSLMMLNPLTHYIEAFRSCVIGGVAPGTVSLMVAYAVGIGTFIFGYWFFRRVRGGFADVL